MVQNFTAVRKLRRSHSHFCYPHTVGFILKSKGRLYIKKKSLDWVVLLPLSISFLRRTLRTGLISTCVRGSRPPPVGEGAMEGEGAGASLGCRRNEPLSPPSRALGPLGLRDASNSLLTLPPTPRAPPLLLPGLSPPEKTLGLNCSSQVSRSKEGPHQGPVVRPGSGDITLTEDPFRMARPQRDPPSRCPLAWHLPNTRPDSGKGPLDQADFSPRLPIDTHKGGCDH